ncbi:MAG: hypothetical protein HRS50_01965 [Mycoplasmataceae bacterium]|nr:hypothetical protein [Mycoplasmataceae bacterium]
MNVIFLNQLRIVSKDVTDGAMLALLIIGIALLLLLVVVSLYIIAGLRRKNVVLKKVDYLIEDITYKSESLNVTVETLNKISNYALSLDAVSQNGFKSAIKLVSENRNYIYSILEKMRSNVEEKGETFKKDIKSKSTNKSKENKLSKNKTTTIKKPVKKTASKSVKKTAIKPMQKTTIKK